MKKKYCFVPALHQINRPFSRAPDYNNTIKALIFEVACGREVPLAG